MSCSNRILLATSNPHKLSEVREVLEPLGFEVVGLDSLPGTYPEPAEDEATFEGNARLKAVGYARSTGIRCLADDSGLVVDVLGGQPGVHSARWAGVDGTRAERDAANNAKLLGAMTGVPESDRGARFVCRMCLADPDGSILAETGGSFEGVITDVAAGENGFGYDPLLHLPGEGCTSAELTPEDKNSRSHRGAAARAMARELMRLRGDES
ncbi:MAG: non-canonical purine NTP pyrophosphatase [Planctomycetota bacterium]|nr:non-canonical purine NTP pyrophosphatase [Planctomycetota bacterium]